MVGPASGGSNPQQAVKVLSLRVPKTLPSNAPVSTALLNGQGSAAPGAQGLTSLVQALMQVFQPHAPQSGGAPQIPGASAPQAPTSAPTFPSSAPQPMDPTFQGNYDTPPEQNAPPFDLGGQQNAPLVEDYGPPQQNAWEQLLRDQSQPLPSYAAGFQPWVSTPTPRFSVENGPTGGSKA